MKRASMRFLTISAAAWLVLLASLCVAGWQVYNIGEISRFSVENVKSAFVPGAGRAESLPREVSQAAELVARNVPLGASIRLDQSLNADALIQQRMWEHLYPVRFSQQDALFEISRNPGPSSPSCRIIERGTHVVLAECH